MPGVQRRYLDWVSRPFFALGKASKFVQLSLAGNFRRVELRPAGSLCKLKEKT